LVSDIQARGAIGKDFVQLLLNVLIDDSGMRQRPASWLKRDTLANVSSLRQAAAGAWVLQRFDENAIVYAAPASASSLLDEIRHISQGTPP
jgi:hypothetical protein